MYAENILGRGLVTPIRRQGGDFAYAEGAARVEARVRQIMKTRRGELRWRPRFGLDIERRRQRNMTDSMIAETQADITNGLLQYEPQIEIREVEVYRKSIDGTTLVARVVWRAIARGAQRNAVLSDDRTTEVEF